MMRHDNACLIFPFSRVNANAISALLGSLDTDIELSNLSTLLPNLKDDISKLDFELKNYEKIILSLSAFSTQFDEVVNYIAQFRHKFEDKLLLVIVGGPHAIGDPLSLLQNGADIVCTGEGEWVFPTLIRKFLSTEKFVDTPGTAYLESNQLIKNERAPLINLDDYPPFSVKRHLIRPIEITRGCAWKCRFCQIRSRGYPVRHRSISKVLEYIQYTMSYFSQRRPDIRFISPNALSYGSIDGKTVNIEIIENLLSSIRNIIGEEGKIYFGSFPSEVRPETITEETAKLLKKYTNVDKIVLGGQSGSNSVLSFSDRGHSVEDTERAVKILVENDLKVDVDVIFGLPGEDDEAVELTKRHMEELTRLGATIHSHTFMPLVGTPFASKEPGRINDKYIDLIIDYQKERKLSGFHVKQSKEARKMAQRRASSKVD